jgi:hypothetical protein
MRIAASASLGSGREFDSACKLWASGGGDGKVMKRNMRNKWGKVIGLGLLGLGAIAILGNIAQNPNVSPNLRFMAQTAEGQLVQDLETGLYYILV